MPAGIAEIRWQNENPAAIGRRMSEAALSHLWEETTAAIGRG